MGTASQTARRSVIRRKDGERIELIPATVGDHAAIEHFLCTVLQRPCSQEFHYQLENPWYEPSDRLLIKGDGQILGHVQLTWRSMAFGRRYNTLCRLGYLGVLPEYRSQGLAAQLVAAAEQRMIEHGALVGELDTHLSDSISDTDWISDTNWFACKRDVFSEASPRDILAELRTREESTRSGCVLPVASKGRKRISVRHWRHVELPALMRIYQANALCGFGYLERSEAYWRWLIGRRAFDHVFVVIEGRDRLELEEKSCRIVGYAVVREHHIVELMVEPGHPTAAQLLLARACGDAIERDWHTVRLHAPTNEPVHDIIRKAGGSLCVESCSSGAATMVSVPCEEDFVSQLGPELLSRGQAGALRLPAELGLAIGKRRYNLSLTVQGAELLPDKLGRSYVTCQRETWVRLLLGYENAPAAFAAGSLKASTALARHHAEVLFPQLPMWRPRWDDLPAA